MIMTNENSHDFSHYELCLCPECGLEFEIDKNNLFYFNSETEESVDFKLDFKNEGIGFMPKIRGHIKESYCISCNTHIKTYSINEINLKDYNDSQIINLVKNGIGKHMESVKNKITKEIKCNRHYSINITENSNMLFINGDPAGFTIIDLSKYSSKSEGLFEGYSKVKNDIDEYYNQEIEKLTGYCRYLHNCQYLVEIDLNGHEEMIELISCEVEGKYRNLNSSKSIECPVCFKKIPEQIYRGVPCPKCSEKLILNEDEIIY